MKQFILFNLFICIFISIVQSQEIGYAYIKSQRYSDIIESNGKCRVEIELSVVNVDGASYTFTSPVATIQSNPYERVCDNFLCFTLDAKVEPGQGDLSLTITDVDSSFITIPNVGYYNCTEAPFMNIMYSHELLAPSTKHIIPFRFFEYNKTSTLSAWIELSGSAFKDVALTQDPYDLSLFIIETSFNFVGPITSYTINVRENTNSFSVALNFNNFFVDWDAMNVVTPIILPGNSLTKKQPIPFSLLQINGNMKNRVIYSNSGTSDLQMQTSMIKVKGNDQSCTVLLIGYINFIMNGINFNVNHIGYQNTQLAQQNILQPGPSTIYSNQMIVMRGGTGSYLPNLGDISMDVVFDSMYYPYSFEYTGDTLLYDNNMEYPYGITSGELGNFKITITEYIESYMSPVTQKVSLFGSLNSQNFDFGNVDLDTKPPKLRNITFTRLDDTPFTLVSAYITDNMSGFYKMEIGDKQYLYAYNGIGDDIYEGLIDINTYFKYIYVYDRAGNSVSYSDRLPNGVLFPKSNEFTMKMITHLEFTSNVVDVSTQGVVNTLYFNFTGAAPGRKILFYPNFKEIPYVSGNNYYDYDPVSQLYVVDFYIPQGLYSQNIPYVLGEESNYYTNEELFYIFRETALIQVDNNDANQIPPLITSVNLFPTQINNIPTVNGAIVIGWDIEIDTQVRTLDYAEFNVTSDHDAMPRTFRFTAEDSMSSNPNLGIYRVSFEITGAERTQIFSISSGIIVDSEGYESTINVDGYNHVWALMKLWNLDLRITVNCPAVSDINSPYLTAWTVNIPQSFSVNSVNRNFTVDFSTKDDESPLSIRHTPIVYLTASFANKMQVNTPDLYKHRCKTELLIQPDPTSANYRTYCNPEFDFGGGLQSLLSVYGIVDQSMNVKGYPATQLADAGYEYYVDTLSISEDPILYSSNVIPGQVSIIGIRMCSQLVPCIIEIKASIEDSYQVYTTPFILYSSVIFSFRPRFTSPFYIRIIKDSNGGPLYSNELLITPIEGTSSGSLSSLSSSDQTSSSSSLSSSSSPVTPSCPGTPPCGGNSKGECLPTGGCKCKYPYYGSDCTSVVIIIPTPKPDPNSPNTTIVVPIPGNNDKQITISSLISVVLLRELDPSNNIVKEYRFAQWIYTPITDSVLLYQTSIVNNNITTNINVTIEFFNTTQIIHFAGQNLTMNPSTIKYKISSDSYSFTNSLNRLQLIMSATFNATSNDGCTFDEFAPTIDQSEYIKLQIDTHSLYGRFIKRGMIDNRATTISNQLLNSEFNAINDLTTTQSYIGINIPFYKRNVVIDPDFSLLVDTSPASDKEGSKCSSKSSSKLSAAKIAGIVIGGVAFVAVIVTSVVYHLYKNKQRQQMENKLKRIQSNKP